MTPGGYDRTFKVADRPATRQLIVKTLNILWLGCIFQVHFDGPWESAFESACQEDLFVYRDMDARHAWDRDGGTDENQPSMIHFIFIDDSVTVVTGDPVEPVAAAVLKMLEAMAP